MKLPRFLGGGRSEGTPSPGPDPVTEPGETTVRPAVDFSSLASAPGEGSDGGPRVDRLQKLLTVLTHASASLLSSTSLDETLARVLDLVFDHLPVQRAFIMLGDGKDGELTVRSLKCKSPQKEGAEPLFSRTIATKVYRERVAILTIDALQDGRFDGSSILTLGIRSAMAAPLWSGERVLGVIYVDTPLRAHAFDHFDLDLLSALGHHVAIAIEQARLRESIVVQELLRRRLDRYHSPAVVERISRSVSSLEELIAEEMDVTVVFADVVDFTRRCETMEPRAVVELLNRYFSEMTEAVFRHEGTLDKFIGDCVMAVFGAPLASSDHAVRAVNAALDMRSSLERLNGTEDAESRLEFRVGIHTGRVIAGDLGSVRRSDYTVLGAAVNVAARLQMEVARPGQIILTEDVRKLLGDRYEVLSVTPVDLTGIARPIVCHELVGMRRS